MLLSINLPKKPLKKPVLCPVSMTQSFFKNLFILTVLLIFGIFAGCQNKKTDDGFAPIFDGKSLNGWKGDSLYWRVENGFLTGEITPETILSRNSFLVWQNGAPENFELKLEYRISQDGNSGINYRSEEIPGLPYALRGYQFDIDGKNNYTGQNYEERRRTTLAYQGQTVVLNPLPDSLSKLPVSDLVRSNSWTEAEIIELADVAELRSHIKNNDWNSCHLIVNGNNMKHILNGVLMSEVTDNDLLHGRRRGLIGVQVHVGPPMKVEFRNIRLKTL